MKRILLTGMSGTGKSTLVQALRARGYKAIDMDEPGWSEYRVVAGPDGSPPAPDWVWREDRVRELLAPDEGEVLFVSGCASNQGQFYPRFDQVVLLSAPPEVIVERLASRTTNPFGKRPEELAKVLEDQRNFEPRLRRTATFEINAGAPFEEVLERVVALVRS